jgi:hypothetical protein
MLPGASKEEAKKILGRLDEKSKIQLGFPYDFISETANLTFLYGNTYSLIDNHRARIY